MLEQTLEISFETEDLLESKATWYNLCSEKESSWRHLRGMMLILLVLMKVELLNLSE